MENMKELDYDLSFIAVGKPESDAKEYLKQSGFKQRKLLTWYDEPEPIIIKVVHINKQKYFENLEYVYSFKGKEIIESVKVKPTDPRLKGTSVELPSSLLKFIRQSCANLFIPPDLETVGSKNATSTKKKNKKDSRDQCFKITYDDLRIETLMMDFFLQVLQMSNWETPQRNEFNVETLCKIDVTKYSYRPVVEPDERKEMGQIAKTEASHMPYLFRKNKANDEIDALCPYCLFKPTYVPYRGSSNNSLIYLIHLLKYHRVLGTRLIKPAIPQIVVRDLKRVNDGVEINNKFLQIWLVCPYRSCKGMSYFFAAKLGYSKDALCFKDQIDVDKIFLEYNEHYLKVHVESNELELNRKGLAAAAAAAAL